MPPKNKPAGGASGAANAAVVDKKGGTSVKVVESKRNSF